MFIQVKIIERFFSKPFLSILFTELPYPCAFHLLGFVGVVSIGAWSYRSTQVDALVHSGAPPIPG